MQQKNIAYFGFLLAFLLISLSGQTQQLTGGVSPFIGVGWLNNQASFNTYFEQEQSENPNLMTKQLKENPGVQYGINGFLHYQVTPAIGLRGGVGFQTFRNKLTIEEKVLTGVDSSYQATQLTARTFLSSVNLPVSIHYRFNNIFSDSLTPFISVGVSIEKILSKTLDIEEERTNYNAATDSERTIIYYYPDIKLSGMSEELFNYHIGIGVHYGLPKERTIYALLQFSRSMYATELGSESIVNQDGQSLENIRILEEEEQQHIKERKGIDFSDWYKTNLRLQIGILF